MTDKFDAIVIGAGVSGLYSLYKLRELGLSARVFEAGKALGEYYGQVLSLWQAMNLENRDYLMGGFATRRFKGTKEIDEAAMAALAAAHGKGTDGLTDDAATHTLLQALAAAGDIYATMQLDVLGPPPHAPPTDRGPASPNATTLRPPPTPTAPRRRSRGATTRGDALPRPLRRREDPHNAQGWARRRV